jgi:DNA mismatch endonuclease vsr
VRETPQQRSRTMRAVHSRDTRPEMVVRRFLHALGLRFRLHDKRLPGTPDLVFASRRVALFVHGCFWHQHPGCPAAARPASHTDYWNRKLAGNIARDARQQAALRALGWNDLHFAAQFVGRNGRRRQRPQTARAANGQRQGAALHARQRGLNEGIRGVEQIGRHGGKKRVKKT